MPKYSYSEDFRQAMINLRAAVDHVDVAIGKGEHPTLIADRLNDVERWSKHAKAHLRSAIQDNPKPWDIRERGGEGS